ncbi:MAG: glycerol-3-phosphate responsive antiterminator [Angelakisella sp.]|nr:glycerol-3-phosphate responsive antiterminator [Angelakisella sp.]
MESISALLAESPIIAAVKDDAGLELALNTDCRMVFLLYGNICNIPALVSKVKAAEKIAMVHVDLVDGLANKEVSVTYIKENTQADGIISTKPAIVKFAKEQGLLTVQRFFLIDSIAMENCRKYIETGKADMVEILPATMPKIIKKIAGYCKIPVIAGGLISDKEDIMLALQAGAMGVSSTNREVWSM